MSGIDRGDPRRLRIALVATAAIAVIECAGGFLSHSIALLTDSAHVALDVLALLIALGAYHFAARPATARRTFGYGRTEILAALLNGGLLFAITVLIVVEAVKRILSPVLPDGPLMASFAAVGLIVNSLLGFMLVRASHHNLSIRAAMMHIVGDALAALGVVIGGIVIWIFGWALVDPILSIVVAGVIVAGVVQVVREASDVLLESAPAHADVETVGARIRGVDGVIGVHDLHVWTLGTDSYALSAHVLLGDRRISDATKILQSIDTSMREEFGIAHVTVQFECESCIEDDRVVCTQMTPTTHAAD